jgi:hypothetical protein
VQQQPKRGLRRFVQTPVGKALLIALTILVVFASFVYVETLIAIPAFLLVGLAVPIWLGIKVPRYLALSGLVVILLTAPLSDVAITQEIMTPIGAASSGGSLPYGNGGAVMQSAAVSPYVGGTSTNFTWTVTIYPQYLPGANSSSHTNSSVLWLALYISTCPGATGNNSPSCSQPYPFHAINDSSVAGITTTTTVTFHYIIGSENIWEWQMGLSFRNATSHGIGFILLQGDPMYNGLEGPVVGSFSSVFATLIPTLYIEFLLYLALPYFFVLLVYMIFKRRERSRQDAARRASGGQPPPRAPDSPPASTLPTGEDAPAATTAAATAAATAGEGACPNCGAVVYANEKTCWKCGTDLTAKPADKPLRSTGS